MIFQTRIPLTFWIFAIFMIPVTMRVADMPYSVVQNVFGYMLAIYWAVVFIIVGLAYLDTDR